MSVKVLHIPISSAGLWAPARIHYENLLALEPHMGVEPLFVGSSTSDQMCDLGSLRFDVAHFHGWPLFSESPQFLEIIKSVLLLGKKIVFSFYTYQNICQNSILESSQGLPCVPDLCHEANCKRALEMFDFMKELNIFVYSQCARDIYLNMGFNKVHLMPICHYESTEYSKPTFSNLDGKIDLVKLYPIAFFKRDRDLLDTVQLDGHVNCRSIKDPFMSFDADYSLCSYSWRNSFPYEVGLSLSKGISPIVLNKYEASDYSDIDGVQYIKSRGDIQSAIVQAMGEKPSESERSDLAYLFWDVYGSARCQAWFRTKYDEIMGS